MLNKRSGTVGAGDRVLLIVAAALLLAIAVSAIGIAIKFEPIIGWGTRLINTLIYGRWETAFAGALILLLALRLLRLSLRGRKAPGAVISSSALGEITITVAAVENMVQRTALRVAGVQEVRPSVVAKSEGIAVRIKTWVEKDAHVPELAEEIQEVLSAYLKEVAGLTTASISVEIQGVGTRTRATR